MRFPKMLKLMSRLSVIGSSALRNIHTSAFCRLREIIIEKPNEKTTVIGCEYVTSPRSKHLIKLDKNNTKCPLCQLRLNIKHTDVLILCQYMDSNGNILKFSETHLCEKQYKLIRELIFMAQYAGLLPEPPREEPKKPYNLLNTYYDETTIKLKRKYKNWHKRFQYLKKKLSPLEQFRIKPDVGPYYGPKIR